MPQAFISHAMGDSDFAQRIAAGLRAAEIDVWIAPESINPGEEFVDAIQRGLSSTTHFVLVMSPEAFESPWVKLEMNTAIRLEREGRMSISPILFRQCQPPLLLGNYQWTEYRNDEASIINRLISWIGPGAPISTRHWSQPRPLTAKQAAQIQAGLDAIAGQVSGCTLCALSLQRYMTVPGEGDPGAQVMFIGEAPGPEDDRTGTPFVSAAGQFLSELLGLIRVQRKDVFLTNIVKCRPRKSAGKNTDPAPSEILACSDYLDEQISLLDPRVIVTLGNHALQRIAPHASLKLSRDHGKPYRLAENRLLFPMYHPAAALYTSKYRNIIIQDYLEMDRYLASIPVAQ